MVLAGVTRLGLRVEFQEKRNVVVSGLLQFHQPVVQVSEVLIEDLGTLKVMFLFLRGNLDERTTHGV